MAALVSWLGGNAKKKNENSVLNTLYNLDVRTNNAVARGNNTAGTTTPTAVKLATTKPQTQTTNRPSSALNTLKTLSTINTTAAPQTNTLLTDPLAHTINRINKLNTTTPNQTSSIGKRQSFEEFKSNSGPVDQDTGWKKYYDDEFKKASSQQNFFQRLLDQGSASRLAETNARNKYANELLSKAYDDNGNTKDVATASRVKQLADYNSQVAKQYNEMERAKSRKIGASADSEYKDNPFYAATNAIRNASLGDALLGSSDNQKTELKNAGKFLIDLLPGLANAPTRGLTNISESISGKGTDSETGKHTNLDLAQRVGRGASGAIDAAGVFFGGSGKLVDSVGKTIFNKGASEAAKQAVKQTSTSVIKDYVKAMLQEGAEEGIQQAFDFFGDGGKLTTKDGEFDADSFKQLLAESGQAAALGAIGGGVFKAGGDAINAAGNAVKNRGSDATSSISPNVNNGQISQAARNGAAIPTTTQTTTPLSDTSSNTPVQAPQNTQFTQDGTAVKTNPDGTTARLSDAELAQAANVSASTQATVQAAAPAAPQTTVQAPVVQTQNTINPIRDNSVLNNTVDRREITELLNRAQNGDAEALRTLQTEYDIDPDQIAQNERDNWRPETVQEVINPEKTQEEEDSKSLLQALSDLWGEGENPDPFKSVGPKYDEDASAQKYMDVLDGKTSFNDYMNEQRELLWKSFKDSNRGTETFLIRDPDSYYQFNNRATVSDNGTLYRMLYSESGQRPTKADFNEALNDVLAKGEQSKYYDAFRELNHDGEMAVFNFNQGNENIEDILALQSDIAARDAETMADNAPILDQQSAPEVGPVTNTRLSDMLDNNGSTTTQATFGQRLQEGADALARALTGQNNLQYATAMAGDGYSYPGRTPQSNANMTNFTIVKGAAPNGGDLVKIDNTVFDGVPNNNKAKAKALQKYLKDKLLGKELALNYGEDGSALITNRGIKEVSRTGTADTRGRVAGNLDEILTVSKVDPDNPTSPDEKGRQFAKDGFEYRQSYVDVDGDIYRVRSNIALSDGKKTFHTINRYSEDKNTPVQLGNSSAGSSGGISTSNVAQPTENVKQNGRAYETEVDALPDNFDVAHYVSDQVKAQKARSKVPLRERIADTTAELKHYLVDDAVAYERYIKDKNERLNIREGVDRVRSSDMIASQYMKDHGLEEIGKLSTKDLNEFQQYLIAKRALEVAEQGKRTGRSKAADQALIKAVGDKYAREEQIIRDYTRSMLEYSAENGLISKKLKDDLLKNNPNYVPMNRVFDVMEKKTGFKSKQLGNLSKQSVVQKMTGSDRTIENPIESLMNNTMRMINEAERNKTAKLIAQSKAFHEKVLADGEEPLPGYDKLSYMVDGKKVSYEVPELVAREMKNLNNTLPEYAENVLKVIGAPTKWLRAGATQNNPIFALSNLVRDQMQTLVTGSTRANLRGTKDAVIATFAPGKKAQALREELNRAGIIGNEYRQTYGYKPGEMTKQLQNGAKLGKRAAERVKHPINALADLIGRTEYFTRAQQYFGTDGDAVTKAQAARNNTLNFGRAGATTRILNRVIPFLNAGVQGGRITVKSFKERPVHTTLAMASLTGVALAAKAAFEAQDSELWDRIDDSDKGQNIIIPTEDAHYDPDTNRVEGIIKIPVAQMLYPFMDAVNNLKGDASDLAMLAGDIFTATTGLEAPNEESGMLPVLNQLTPTAVKPFLEAGMNKSTYTGNDLVSEYDNNKNPEDKGAKYTTGLARTIAGATGIDAPVVDNFIQNWGGGLTKDLSKALTDNPDNKSDGGGVGAMFDKGFTRRFLSGTITSQYDIADGLAKGYKNEIKNVEGFNDLSKSDQQKVLNAIDSDMSSIASMAAKVEQGRTDDIGDKKLTKRQTEITNNGFNAESYIRSVLDKKASYSASESESPSEATGGSDVKTLGGELSEYGKTTSSNKKSIEISDLLNSSSKDFLTKYNSMSKDEWNDYLYGSTAENAAAEYNLAKAKYENDLASDKLSNVQKIKKQKELTKLEVSQKWTKDIRDAYSLAGTKADIQALLNGLEGEERTKAVGALNGLNNAMYEAGIISKSTYNSRGRNINNLTSSKSSSGRKSSRSRKSSGSSGISSAEASAMAKAVKAMSNNSKAYDVETPKAPSTNRKLTKTRSSKNNYSTNTYTPKKATVSVQKGLSKKVSKS